MRLVNGLERLYIDIKTIGRDKNRIVFKERWQTSKVNEIRITNTQFSWYCIYMGAIST